MAEQDGGETTTGDDTAAAHDLQSEIKVAMQSRIAYFKEQADSLTLEKIRRVLEEDLKLEVYALDVHKRYIKQSLSECFEGSGDDDASKCSGETVENATCLTKVESKSPKDPAPKKDSEELRSEDEAKEEDSPVLGLMTGKKTKKAETGENRDNNEKEVLSESMIKKAIRKREAHIQTNSETITMVGVRRLLEEDLKLDTRSLDPYKKFISGQIDMILKAFEASESAKAKTVKAKSSKPSKDETSQECSHSSDGESEEEEVEVKPKKRITTNRKSNNAGGSKKRKMTEKEDKTSKKRMKQADTLTVDGSDEEDDGESEEEEVEVKPKKRITTNRKSNNAGGSKKRKMTEKEDNTSKKRMKQADTLTVDGSDEEDDGNNSDGSHSQSASEKFAKKKDVPTPAYGKRVEHLKAIIKSCGMSVPPNIYKKVKQAPENKREACLIKELEEILSREGLSSNPSEKEMKEVKRKKDRARELEGIDMSNIVSSSRRRSTTSFIPPPKPKIPVESESDDSEEGDNESNSDEENSEDSDENNTKRSDDANTDENEAGEDDDNDSD